MGVLDEILTRLATIPTHPALSEQVNDYQRIQAQPYEDEVINSQRNPPALKDALAKRGRNMALTVAKNIIPNPQDVGSVGLAGSIRLPEDMIVRIPGGSFDGIEDVSVAKHFSNLLKNYATKTWATKDDPLVKLVDSGFNPSLENNRYAIPPVLSGGLSKAEKAHLEKLTGAKLPAVKRTPLHFYSVLSSLMNNEPLTKAHTSYIEHAQETADTLRKARGTPQIATTPGGKLYENINDINALLAASKNPTSGFQRPINLKAKHAYRRAGWALGSYGPDSEAYNKARGAIKSEMSPLLNSPYAKSIKTHPTALALLDPMDSLPRTQSLWAKHILDNIQPTLPPNTSISLPDALMRAKQVDLERMLVKQKELTSSQFLTQLANVKPLPTTNNWVNIVDPAALAAEGKLQKHCVGTYGEAVRSGRAEIYSLRDAEGKPYLTAEWNPIEKEMVQVKGKLNAKPTKEHKAAIDELKNYLLTR